MARIHCTDNKANGGVEFCSNSRFIEHNIREFEYCMLNSALSFFSGQICWAPKLHDRADFLGTEVLTIIESDWNNKI